MRGNSDNSDSVELPKFIILELLRDCPRNEIARRSHTALHGLADILFADFAFKGDLNRTQNVWQLTMFGRFLNWPQQNENLVSRGITEHLQIIGRVFVVTRDKDGHQLGQERLTAAVVAEECVPVHVVELALGGLGETPLEVVHLLSSI